MLFALSYDEKTPELSVEPIAWVRYWVDGYELLATLVVILAVQAVLAGAGTQRESLSAGPLPRLARMPTIGKELDGFLQSHSNFHSDSRTAFSDKRVGSQIKDMPAVNDEREDYADNDLPPPRRPSLEVVLVVSITLALLCSFCILSQIF